MTNDEIKEIDDNELDAVSGGAGGVSSASKIPFACTKPNCGEMFYVITTQSVAVCPKCKACYEIKG